MAICKKQTFPALVKINIGIDGFFTVKEKEYIIEALIRWQEGTQGLVLFHIGNMNIKNMIMHDDDEFTWYAINIIKTKSSDQIVKDAEDKLNMKINGVAFNHPKTHWIFVVVDKIHSENEFIGLVMHEVGHLLGLKHQNNTVMHPYSNRPNHVTLHDFNKLIAVWRNYLWLAAKKHDGTSSSGQC